jgi:hypothetical protein
VDAAEVAMAKPCDSSVTDGFAFFAKTEDLSMTLDELRPTARKQCVREVDGVVGAQTIWRLRFHLARLLRRNLCGCGRTQVSPFDIWPQMFTSDLTIGEPLNGGAVFGRNTAIWDFPLSNRAFCNLQFISQRLKGADDGNGFVQCFFWGHLRGVNS